MNEKLNFKDFLSVDYTPGMPGQISKNAKKRKQDIPTGNTGESVKAEAMEMCEECGMIHDGECDMDEALNMQQRRAKARQMKRLKSKIKIGRDRAARKMASPEKLKQRSRKAARKAVFTKLAKQADKGELTYQRRQEIEKRLDTPAMKRKIDQLSRKMLPTVRKKEQEKKSKRSS